jgi:hypothetical protein
MLPISLKLPPAVRIAGVQLAFHAVALGNRDAVVSTVREITTLSAPQSEAVVQFIAPSSSLSAEDAAVVTLIAEGATLLHG